MLDEPIDRPLPVHDTTSAWRDLAAEVPTGPFVAGAEAGAGADDTVAVTDPSTGEPFVEVGVAGTDGLLAAVAAAHDAAPGWAATPPRARAEVLRRAHDALVADAERVATLIVLENGKTLADARAEVRYAADYLLWFSESAAHIAGSHTVAPSGDKHILTSRRPIGPCLLVTPWNFPAAMVTRKVGPALAAGCTVVVKPAEATPLTALLLARLLTDAGAPPGVVNVVPCADPPTAVGAALHDGRVRKLSFTGSTAVGTALLRAAADQVLACSMELGGNAPFVVLDDADLDAAVAGAVAAKMRNGGQACTAANRFHVHRSLVDPFTARLADALAAARLGGGLCDGVDVGPLVDRTAVAKVKRLVDTAVAGGATVRTGGHRVDGPGSFFLPTVLGDVGPDDGILDQEVFGPVAPVVVFDDDDEAVAQANASVHGLAAYVFTGDVARGLSFADGVEAGMVGLNRGVLSDAAAPFGGVKRSGLGREGGTEGIDAYLETKYVATDW